jgi:hypothetical protein
LELEATVMSYELHVLGFLETLQPTGQVLLQGIRWQILAFGGRMLMPFHQTKKQFLPALTTLLVLVDHCLG